MISPARLGVAVCPILAAAVTSPVVASTPSAAEAISAPTPQRASSTHGVPTGGASRGGALAAMNLNHFYVTLDTATYAAIRDAKLLKEQFGVFEERTTKRGDITYTGIYFYGDQTYFEIFNPDGRGNPASNGIAFGVDAVGDAKKVAPEIGETLITRELGGVQIPWFKMGTLPRPMTKTLAVWIMEYVPEFLQRWNPQTGTPEGVSREAVLRRYAAALKDTQSTKLMQNVTGLSLTLTADERDEFVAKARGFGCAIEQRGEITLVRTASQELRIATGTANRITEARFQLRKKTPAADHHFGSTTLRIAADGTAVWTF